MVAVSGMRFGELRVHVDSGISGVVNEKIASDFRKQLTAYRTAGRIDPIQFLDKELDTDVVVTINRVTEEVKKAKKYEAICDVEFLRKHQHADEGTLFKVTRKTNVESSHPNSLYERVMGQFQRVAILNIESFTQLANNLTLSTLQEEIDKNPVKKPAGPIQNSLKARQAFQAALPEDFLQIMSTHYPAALVELKALRQNPPDKLKNLWPQNLFSQKVA